MGWKQILIIVFLFFLTFIPRLYKIDNPVADWHSWRQADTAAVTRNFIKEGLTPLYPKFDSFFALNENGLPNPNRYFFAEFPLYNLLTYPFYKFFGVNEIYARGVSVFLASLTSVVLFLLVKRYSSFLTAFLSGLFFAILPFNIYYGQVIMPDPTFIFFSVLSLLMVSYWLEKEKWWLVGISGIVASLAMLTKPYAIFLGLPVAYLFFSTRTIPAVPQGRSLLNFFKKPQFYLYLILAFLPFLAWRWHINQHPEGMFGTSWLFNQGNIRFKGAFFRWLVFERMNKLIFATGGFVLLFLGLVSKRSKKEGWFFYLWFASVFIYMTIFAKGNVTHDYYQLPLVPIGCIFIAKGTEFLLKNGKGILERILNWGLALSLIFLMLAFGWYEVRGFFNINHPEIVKAGQGVDQLLPKDAKVIAPYQADSAFLYQTNRYGWTVSGLANKFIQEGATHYVSVNFDEETNNLMEECNIVKKTNEWVIIDLEDCKSNDGQKFSPENQPGIEDVQL